MINSLSGYLVAGKNEFLTPSANGILVSDNVENKDNNTMAIFKTDKLPDELSKLYQVNKNEQVKETNNNEQKESVWAKIKSFVKNNIPTVACAALAAVALSISIPALCAGAITAASVCGSGVGIALGGVLILSGFDSYFSPKDNQKYYSEMKTLTEDKNEEADKKALDATVSKKVDGSISSKEFVSFKVQNGTLTQTLKMPMTLDMNKLLEKYSDEQSPEISENEQKAFLNDVNEFFDKLKEKTNHSIAFKEYSFGQYNIPDSLKELEKIKGNIQQLITQTTDEESSSGKSIDKNELLKLRQQIFLALNN